ncbi:MAG: hypothetical protein R3F02_12580 [Thiolinea sp.]
MHSITVDLLSRLQTGFANAGFVLFEVKPLAALPPSIWLKPFTQQHGSLLLLGQAGKSFWPPYKASQPEGDDPVDDYSADISEQLLTEFLPKIAKQRLFPDPECPVNLMALGRELGWHTPSPLGLGIHRKYGLWSAYRALWWLDALPEREQTDASPCDEHTETTVCADCRTQDCVRRCPVEAIKYGNMPDITRCADYRYQPGSHCDNGCQARLACPVAAEHRYSDEQFNYHYDLKRSMLHQYRSAKSS